MEILISEVFTSLQGESSYVGRLCHFVRLAGCNLNCKWCDTPYARTTGGAKAMTVGEILDTAKSSGTRLVEITGGEPLLQKGTPELSLQLIENGFQLIIETNGSIPIRGLSEQISFIIDCKCPSSGESGKMHFDNYREIRDKDEVKFVVADRSDYEYAVMMAEKYDLHAKTEKVFFSPVWGLLEPAKLADWMVADKSRAVFGFQLHKMLWGADARGK